MNLNNFKLKQSTSNAKLSKVEEGNEVRKLRKIRTFRKDSTFSSQLNWGKNNTTIVNSSASRNSTVSSDNEHRIVVALTEGRGDARCEVGLAVIDITVPNLILCQISDTSSYLNTLTKINIFNPTDILVPSTFIDIKTNRLASIVKEHFSAARFISVPRKNFNKMNGYETIQQLCLPEMNTILVGLQHRYYALAAASALFLYLQQNMNIFFANESVQINYQESEGFAIIDVSTADRLELVSSTKPTQATRYSSLFDIINHCFTKIGARTLRSTILQPPCDIPLIEERLECVSELIKKPEKLLSIQALLQKFIHIEQLLTLSTIYPNQAQNCSHRQLNYILLLNNLVDLIEPLKEILGNCHQPFFIELKETLGDERFTVIKTKIRSMIHTSAHPSKGQDGIIQRCFAIKPEINGLLDLVRKTYSERLNDMREYVRLLSNKYNLSLSLGNNNAKGYHIVLHLNKHQKRYMKKSDLPTEFNQVYRLAGSFTMKTSELINFSTRLDDIMMEIIKISNAMIYQLLTEIKQYIGLFYKVCEGIAKLDMLQSLAQTSMQHHYTRPKFESFTEILNAYHPLLDVICQNRPIPNAVSVCNDFNIQIITGPNGSGKSIYIRQVMLLQVMAQIGCYVPASSAIFRPADRMFARVYLEDDMEFGASAFILEIKEIKCMMTTITDNSLFIIDEICRSTSLEEGMVLAMALCEKLLTTSAFLFITTHFTMLTKLYDMYLNVKVWQMETIADGNDPKHMTLDFKYFLTPGITSLKNYSAYLVRSIWPESVVDIVYNILDKIGKNDNNYWNFYKIIEGIRLKYKLESNLKILNLQQQLTKSELNKCLNCYLNDLGKMKNSIHLRMINKRIDEPLTTNKINESLKCLQGFEIKIGQKPIDCLNNFVEHTKSMIEHNQNNFNFNPINMQQYQNIAISKNENNIVKLSHDEIMYSNGLNFFEMKMETNSVASEFIAHNSLQSSFQRFNDSAIPSNLNYNNLPQFFNKNSDNLEKLVPEVNIIYSNEPNDNVVECSLSLKKNYSISSTPSFENKILSGYIKDDEVESVMDDLRSCSNSFFENFIPHQTTLHTACENNNSILNCISEKPQHIVPIVKIIEGPTCSSISFGSENDFNGTQSSINYSPLCSSSLQQESMLIDFIPELQHDFEPMEISAIHDDYNNYSKPKISSRLRENTNCSFDNNIVIKSSSANVISNKGQSEKNRLKTISPQKLTKKQIEMEFNAQDRIIYENSLTSTNVSKYLCQLLNRPSVKQVQNTAHLAVVRRSEDGIEVIPGSTKQKGMKNTFDRMSTNGSIDISIFSDINAKPFTEFLNSADKDYKMFNFDFNINQQKHRKNSFNFKQNEPAIADFNFEPCRFNKKNSEHLITSRTNSFELSKIDWNDS